MPRKRGVSARPSGAQPAASVAFSPTARSVSASSSPRGSLALRAPAAPQHSFGKCEPKRSEGNLLAGEDHVPAPVTRIESTHTPEANDSAFLVASQEDACTFHSPRSFPGDVSEGGSSLAMGPTEAGAPPSGPLDAPELLQPLSAHLKEADASFRSAQSHPSPQENQSLSLFSIERQTQLQAPTDQRQQGEGAPQAHEQEQPQKAQQKDEAGDGAPTFRTSPLSESEGEWIRVEVPDREKTGTAGPRALSVSPECLDASVVAASSAPYPPIPCLGAPPHQSFLFPICIGSATQTEENAVADSNSIVPLRRMIDGEANEGDAWGPPTPSAASSSDGCCDAGPKSFLSRLSGYGLSLTSSVRRHCSAQLQQQQQKDAPRGETEEVTDLQPDAKRNGGERGKLLQRVMEWHQCLLEMYGGTVEDITRLALQVLPAQATGDLHLSLVLHSLLLYQLRLVLLLLLVGGVTWPSPGAVCISADDQSERRLLVLQGLFDVFCIYRAHFLAPSEGLLQAEALHQQWKLLAERSLRRSGDLACSTPSLSSALSVDGRFTVEGEREAGLPASVRLALYGATSLALKVVRALQLLLEVNRLRRGSDGLRFALCMRLELLKLVLKMILYALTPFAFYCDEQSIYQALAAHREKQVRHFLFASLVH